MSYVDPKIGHAQEPFRSALAGLLNEANGAVWIGNAWRSTKEQERLYDRWIRKVPGQARAAKPGTSNHEYGLASDIVGDKRLAARLAPKYGLHFPVTGEDWHIEKKGVNRHTHPNPWSPGDDTPDDAPPIYPGVPLYGGVRHPAVAQWKVMGVFAGYTGLNTKPSGVNVFGPGTVRMTKRFQRNHGLKVDGIVGPVTWEKMRQVVIAKRARKG